MNYWILNFKQSWHDLLGIMLFTPILTIVLSIFIFVWCFKMLTINSVKASLRQQGWRLFISLYAVGSCWAFIFGICLLLIAPSQIYKSQSPAPAHLAKSPIAQNAELNGFQSDMTNDYT